MVVEEKESMRGSLNADSHAEESMRHERVVGHRGAIVWRRLGFLLLLLSLAFSFTPTTTWAQLYEVVGRGDLSQEDEDALRALIFDFGFTDVAEVWVGSRLKRASSGSRPTLEWARVDIFRAEGEIDRADELNQSLAAKYPNHARAGAAQLEAVQATMAQIFLLSLNAQYETDSTTRAQLIAERDSKFKSEVAAELDATIRELNQEVEREPDDRKKSFERDRWEHYRLQAYLQYAELLPYGSPGAVEMWESLVTYATDFVENRYDNDGFLYEAQLFLGKAYAALGLSEEAAEALEVITEVEPTSPPPYDEIVVRFIRLLRLQALQGTAEAWNRAGQPENAVQIFEDLDSVPQPHFPWKMDPEDLAVLPFVVAVEIEEAIARLAGGVRQEGIDHLRSLIDRFDSPSFRKANPDSAEAYLLDIAAGLARAMDIGVDGLPAEFYYRAALGFKGRGRYDDAIAAAQAALNAGSGVRGAEKWVALSLYEIGENFDSLDLPEAAANAFQTLSLQFFSKKADQAFETLLADASQNWFAISGELAERQGGAWVNNSELGKAVFGELSRGEAGITLTLQNCGEKESRGLYEQAYECYSAVPQTFEKDGRQEKYAGYFRAMARAGKCLFLAADSVGEGRSKLPEVEAWFSRYIQSANAESDAVGEAALRFELASVYWDDDVRDRGQALATLEPVLSQLSGANLFREGALRLWIAILTTGSPDDPTRGVDPKAAEPVLAALKRDFAKEVSVPVSLYSMVEAYQSLLSEEGNRRAAELVTEYMQHPEAGFDAAGPGVKLTIAQILFDGMMPERANQILEEVTSETGENESLEIAVALLLASSGNLSGDHVGVLRNLEPFLEKYGSEIRDGSIPEGPKILWEAAKAESGQYRKDRDGDRLKRASQQLESAIAVLQQRRMSLKRTGKITPKFENEYWLIWLQYFEVLKADNRMELVCSLIEGERIKKGGEDFAPAALQLQFNDLEKECKP